MKFIHLSDLHIGKRVNEFSMIEDQKYILTKILNIIDDEAPDGVIIAGDVYDKSIPSTEAVELFDDFLVRLEKRKTETFIISGNHDSPERLAFGGRLIDACGIHISPVYDGDVRPFTLKDKFGDVNIYMLPFIKPANVRRIFPEEEIASYTDAVRVAVEKMNVDTDKRNILVTHQFVTGASTCDSEEKSIGGSDNVDLGVFEAFDYVALGHIHGPQNVGSLKIRYCGTPLKYSFSEKSHKKSVTVFELGDKGELGVRTVPLVPMHDMAEIKGSYDELMLKSFYENTTYREDYMRVILTDEEDIPNAFSKLRVIYKNIMKLDYDNSRTRHNADVIGADVMQHKTPLEHFSEFYQMQNGTPMSEEQFKFMSELIEKIQEG